MNPSYNYKYVSFTCNRVLRSALNTDHTSCSFSRLSYRNLTEYVYRAICLSMTNHTTNSMCNPNCFCNCFYQMKYKLYSALIMLFYNCLLSFNWAFIEQYVWTPKHWLTFATQFICVTTCTSEWNNIYKKKLKPNCSHYEFNTWWK